MKIGTNGIVVNEYGQVLLIQRDDTLLYAPPGGGLEMGELPTECVTREVREETGLITYPARLVALYFWRLQPQPHLFFIFRCLKRGGELAPSPESRRVGFFPGLPRLMANLHRERMLLAVQHRGGGAVWREHRTAFIERLGLAALKQIIYPWKNWRRRQRGELLPDEAPGWQTEAVTVIRNDQGAVLWVKRADSSCWHLPGGSGLATEAPWETAVRETYKATGLNVLLDRLSGVYTYANEAHMAFTFTTHSHSGTLTHGPKTADFAFFAPGQEPVNAVKQHVERMVDALQFSAETVFRHQSRQTE